MNKEIMLTKKELIARLSLKKVKTFRGREGDGFNADLYFDNIKVVEVDDDGWGGEYHFNVLNPTLYDKIKFYVKAMPPHVSEYGDSPENLEFIISDLLNERRKQKDVNKGVMVKTNWGWETVGFNVSIPTLLKKYSDGLEALQGVYDKVKSEGKEVLNTEYLKTVGINL